MATRHMELGSGGQPGQGCSPAHHAVLQRDIEAIRDPAVRSYINSQNYSGAKTPLLLAIECISKSRTVKSSDKDFIQQLLNFGASADIGDRNGETVYHYAARIPRYGDHIAKLLPPDRALLDRPSQSGLTALLLACQLGKFGTALVMAKAGATVDVMDDLGYPIHYAMKHSHMDLATVIFDRHREHGKKACFKHGGTPLHWARDSNFVKLVLQQDYDIDAMSKTGDTALLVMVKRNRPIECLRDLLNAGADPNFSDRDGNSPLHYAVKKRDRDIIRLLVSRDADVNRLNHDKESPRHLAAKDIQGDDVHSEIIELLHGVGASRCKPGMRGCQEDGRHDVTDRKDVNQQNHVLDRLCRVNISNPLGRGGDEVDGVAIAMKERGTPPKPRSKDAVLCLDGGGIKGLVLIKLLAAIEKSSGRRITELFDWIVGTSTGGILAIALLQGFSVEKCQKLYLDLKDKVFDGPRPYDAGKLEQCLKDYLGEKTRLDQFKYPRILVSGTLADRNPAALHFFRNFEAPKTSSARIGADRPEFDPIQPQEGLAWYVARCTGAAPTFFPPMGRFLDGGLICNNPTLDALTEIHEFYIHKKSKGEPVREIGVVVSLGTGWRPPSPVGKLEIFYPTEPAHFFQNLQGGVKLLDLMIKQVCDSDLRAVDRARTWCYTIGVPFFRLSPQLSGHVALDEKDDTKLEQMMCDSMRYVTERADEIGALTNTINSL
ncbi:85/88 kDa calcium-independent phospholipase A2-like [Diadema setosum]|uniref:85/88 kDa calcium-independent phospholipase A2-like n=1 Tax=Diadema setosum TaxID=31175 RepID=UPI003B3BDB59